MTSELNKPLGQNPQSDRKRRTIRVMPWLLGGMVVVYAIIGSWIVLVDDPMAGQPMATAQIERTPVGAPEQPAAQQVAEGKPPASGQIQLPLNDTGSGPLIIKIPPSQSSSGAIPPRDVLAAAADIEPELLEETGSGSLPRVAFDGRKPSDVYARPSLAEGDSRPKIAIMIGGLGIGAAATEDAINKLPADISLGFAPYGKDLEKWAQRAREDGHEILLQVPMEPFDYPSNDPGPQTLLTQLSSANNLQRLHWVMSRLKGYVGLSNYMGAKFTANEAALKPVLNDIQQRGLVFLDDGSSPRSLTARLGGASGAPVGKAEVEIDARPNSAAIDAALARLEEAAKRNGIAIGTGSALPVTLERVIQWSASLEQRGILLVPVSTAIKSNKPS